jgi:hypothetical protein
MSGYNFNLYNGGGIPDQGANGLPLVIADANIPTQAVSDSPIQRATSLPYSPYMVESGLRTPATTLPKAKSAQQFDPTPQPKQSPLWRTIINAVIGGKIKTGSSYAAVGDYTSGAPGVNGSMGGGVGGTVNTRATIGTQPSRASSV